MISSYVELLKLKFTHHYFLDEGEDVYGVDMTAAQEALNLRLYNIADFLSIVPSEKTEKTLKNWRSRMVINKDGFSILTKSSPSNSSEPFIGFEDDMFFDFVIKIKDNFFENYTEIEIDRSKLVFISNAAPTPAVLTSETATSIQQIAISDFGNAYTDMDIELSDDIESNELIGAFGVIRINLEGDVGEINLSNGASEFAATTPTPELVFTNRQTKWRFIDSSDGSVLKTTDDPIPLTKNGYVVVKKGSLELPNPKPNLIILESGDYYSEVFI
jgi:hypothetical protein